MERPVLEQVGAALKLSPTQVEKLEKYSDERLLNVLMGYNDRKANIINGWGWFLNVITNGYVFKPAKPVTTAQEKRVFSKTNSTAPQHATTVKPKSTAELKAEQKLKEQTAPKKSIEKESAELAIESVIKALKGPTETKFGIVTQEKKIASLLRFGGKPKEWDLLTPEVQEQFLTNEPWFAEVVGLSDVRHEWQEKHDRMIALQEHEESFAQHSF